MAKMQAYSVSVQFKDLELGVSVSAESLEQAIAKVASMKTVDVLAEYEDFNDGTHAVYGVWRTSR